MCLLDWNVTFVQAHHVHPTLQPYLKIIALQDNGAESALVTPTEVLHPPSAYVLKILPQIVATNVKNRPRRDMWIVALVVTQICVTPKYPPQTTPQTPTTTMQLSLARLRFYHCLLYRLGSL